MSLTKTFCSKLTIKPLGLVFYRAKKYRDFFHLLGVGINIGYKVTNISGVKKVKFFQ